MFMIMDLLGPNLADLMVVCGGKFSIRTAILLTIQIVVIFLCRLRGYRHCIRLVICIEI